MQRVKQGRIALALGMALTGWSAADAQAVKTEAPALAALVKEGKLPPVADRVGAEPEVVKPLESVGRYGGQLGFGLRG